MNRTLPFLLLLLALLTGCASRAQRVALRHCQFTPRSTRIVTKEGDSMIVSVGFDLHNPGPTPVVLDSFVATASTSRPLAHFSHGTMQQIPEGKTELVEFRLALANNQLMSQALLLAMSPPDSIRVEGTAWIPNFFGFWTSEKSFQASLPYQTLKGSLQSLFH